MDASIAVQWLSDETGSETAIRLVHAPISLVAPDFMPIEAANAWWKKARRGDMPAADVEQAVASLLTLDIELVPTLGLLTRAARLATTLHHPVYDCLYIVVATRRGAQLATADERLRRLAQHADVPLWRR